MSQNDIGQLMLAIVGGGMFLALCWAIFIQGPKQWQMMMAPWAAKHGLQFIPPASKGFHTIGHEVSVAQGAVNGVQMRLMSSRLANSQRAGVQGFAEVQCRALAPAQVGFQLSLERGGSGPPPADLVNTGDPRFDFNLRPRSDNPHAARVWLDPAVKNALAEAMRDFFAIHISYAGGEITIRFDKPVWEAAQFDRVIALVHAAGYARLG